METVAIQTRFMGPTNRLGARIVATTANGHRLVRPYSHAHAAKSHAIVVAELARMMGWEGDIVAAGTGDGYVFVQSSASSFNVSDGSPFMAGYFAAAAS